MGHWSSEFEANVGQSLNDLTHVSGGDIAAAYRAELDGQPVFLKYLSGQDGQHNLHVECQGLKWLGEVSGVYVPGNLQYVQLSQGAVLIMTYIKPGTQRDYEALGIMLARLHNEKTDQFGWDEDNFIGRLPQYNTAEPTWPQFWAQQRLRPQIQWARESNLLPSKTNVALDSLVADLPNRLPDVSPSRLHGDLWNGNVIFDKDGKPYFIDPAVYSGHGEVDLAMMSLFGGFPDITFEAYQHHTHLLPDWSSRLPLYQLYYALAHLNMFGRQYLGMVEDII